MNFKLLAKKSVFFINRNPLSRFVYNREIYRRSKLKLSEINPLSKHIQVFSPFTNEINPSNDWYGHAKIFKKYMGLPENYSFKSIIEHGTYPTEQVSEVELEPNLPSYITYSKYRVGILKKYRDFAFCIGPFIHYAPYFFGKQKINAEKRRLGKNLLVFPAHSASYIIPNYDNSWFMRNVKKLATDFDTVRICLYWADIQLGLHKYYKKLGYECVCAGHILDPNFLSRLKTIIETSDHTVSNDVGTHVSYSTYLEKPHVIFHKAPKIRASKKWSEMALDYWSSKPYLEILNAFSKVSPTITQVQRNVLSRYYGDKKDVKSPVEFRKIVKVTEEINKNG